MGGGAPTAPGEEHETATGATAEAAKDALKHDPEGKPTVPEEATHAPVPNLEQYGVPGVGTGPRNATPTDTGNVLCGPLLNYRRMSEEFTQRPRWHGSVLVVTEPGQRQPELRLQCAGRVGPGTGAHNTTAVAGDDTTLPTTDPMPKEGARRFMGEKLYEDPVKSFWRFQIDLPIQEFEARWKYTIPRLQFDGQPGTTKSFVVPSTNQSMRVMFHSCNGFSVGTDEDAWSGPALWNDVLRMHKQHPFHVMIGGGDQIYNDGVRVDGPLRPWTDIGNPKKRRDFPFNEDMRSQCDKYYFDNYVKWYGQEPFKSGNCAIPQVNIWDDHDIIDGFGSYTDHFMKCAVFRGIGGVAHKYYMLFQHHLAPPVSTFTTDAPQTTHHNAKAMTTAADAVQLKDTWVNTSDMTDSAYIKGQAPGPYVEETSRSIYCQLGARMAFAGIDARTERTRHQINYPETYNLIMNRIDGELARSKGQIKHLLLLLGVPIAYPRLAWLENIFTSPIIGPLRFLNKRFGFGGGFFNHFDGNVDLLDDLDDHYTARLHKHERRDLIHRLQDVSKKHSVRITILGGDVHLAAIGRFYSKPELQIPAERDYRYMPNVISSAITNKPPPQAVANLLARRNKIHHLDHETDETLLTIFDRDPGHTSKAAAEDVGKKSADANHVTMPSRNYAIIAESHHFEVLQTNGHRNNPANNVNGSINGAESVTDSLPAFLGKKINMRLPFHLGEKDAGTTHAAAHGSIRSGLGGQYGLDVTLRVEISNKDKEGKTDGYGFSIPGLECEGYKDEGRKW